MHHILLVLNYLNIASIQMIISSSIDLTVPASYYLTKQARLNRDLFYFTKIKILLHNQERPDLQLQF